MPNVNASKIDWPSESTETHWPPTVQGSGEPAGMARGAQRREWSLPVCKIKGGFMEEVVSGWGLEGIDFESSPSPLAWSPGQAEYVWVVRQLLCRGSCGWDGDREILTLDTLVTLAREQMHGEAEDSPFLLWEMLGK